MWEDVAFFHALNQRLLFDDSTLDILRQVLVRLLAFWLTFLQHALLPFVLRWYFTILLLLLAITSSTTYINVFVSQNDLPLILTLVRFCLLMKLAWILLFCWVYFVYNSATSSETPIVTYYPYISSCLLCFYSKACWACAICWLNNLRCSWLHSRSFSIFLYHSIRILIPVTRLTS